MNVALIFALVLLMGSIVLQTYHLVQFTKKRKNMLVRSHTVESHLSKGIASSFVAISIVVIIGVLMIFTK